MADIRRQTQDQTSRDLEKHFELYSSYPPEVLARYKAPMELARKVVKENGASFERYVQDATKMIVAENAAIPDFFPAVNDVGSGSFRSAVDVLDNNMSERMNMNSAQRTEYIRGNNGVADPNDPGLKKIDAERALLHAEYRSFNERVDKALVTQKTAADSRAKVNALFGLTKEEALNVNSSTEHIAAQMTMTAALYAAERDAEAVIDRNKKDKDKGGAVLPAASVEEYARSMPKLEGDPKEMAATDPGFTSGTAAGVVKGTTPGARR